ncbi:MAG TPA: biopolymer transporter ExbD [Syntrophales bacterium]|nr:biopolymer transporter ExbD [Syntrophales bacterium]HOM07981.1 biopolymer transporter ExbD [Syntrophales bacterium]HOO00597.1 biopolymer transporter ExbD [Syntrophales bacterium]HPC01542.1 biopolymer transporter ExbD [Syntrophales bacterium]HPQ06659.1 biopolymer transporter ExbD [Syntrophales bacterium]
MRHLGENQGGHHKPLADINVTPLVDVVLVLLIIFMVTAPMLQTGIDVNLPRVQAKSFDVQEEKLILTINDRREIFINKLPVTLEELQPKLEAIFSSRVDREIFLRADRNVSYGFVVEVMGVIRKAGVDRLGMITESPETTR